MEETDDTRPRTAQEVAQRVLGILAGIGKVHFPEDNLNWMERESIYQFLSPLEAEFVKSENPTDQEKVEFSWRAEALVSLLWSLYGISNMPPLNEQFETFQNDMVVKAIRETQSFLAGAVIRPVKELEEMESFLYHQHWRVRDRDYGFNMDKPDKNDPDISMLDSGIVYERRYGMSWVIGYGETWDDVPTDT